MLTDDQLVQVVRTLLESKPRTEAELARTIGQSIGKTRDLIEKVKKATPVTTLLWIPCGS